MRGLTSTIILLVALAGLGGYIYFVESKREPTDAAAKAKAFELTAENIDELQIRNATGGTSRVRREGGVWKLVEPVKADADNGVVGSVTSNLASLEVQRVVEESPKDLAQYGLNPARIEVGFRLRDQKDFQRLLVGEKTPTGGDLYAKRANENRVILVASFLDSILNKTALELRDKTILKVDRDKAQGLDVVHGATTIQFVKNGLDWRIVKPFTARAEYGPTEGLLTKLTSTNMLSVISEGGDLAPYGLDHPSLSIAVLAGSSRATLLLGKLGKDNTYFAKDASRPVVFSVEQSLYNDFTKDVSTFRRKDLFDARSFSANWIELQRGATTVVFQKTTADGKDTWRNAAGQTFDTAKVDDVLTKLSNLQAQSFQSAAHPSLANPVLVATIRFDESKTETVTFGRSGKDVFASRSEDAGAARIDTTGFDVAMKAVDGLK